MSAAGGLPAWVTSRAQHEPVCEERVSVHLVATARKAELAAVFRVSMSAELRCDRPGPLGFNQESP